MNPREHEADGRERPAGTAAGTQARPVLLDLTSKPSVRPDLTHDVSWVVSYRQLVPLVAFLETALVIALVAALLYSVPEAAARWVALAAGASIVLATALVSRRRTFTSAVFGRMALLTVYPLAIAVVFVNVAKLGAEGEPAADSRTPGRGGTEISLAAEDLSFGTSRLEMPARTSTTLSFANQDQVPHNLSIYENPEAKKSLFRGEIIEGGESVDYVIEGLAPGRYYFRCDVHPTMHGRAVAG